MAGVGSIGRRALLGAALLTAGAAAGVVVAPEIQGRGLANDAIQLAYDKGMQDARQAILNEFKQRGVSLGAAQVVARNTQSATRVIAQPVAGLLVAIVGDALSSLVSALDTAQKIVSFLSSVADLIGKVKDLFAGWQSDLETLSVSVDELPAIDTEEAAAFLDVAAEVLPELLI